LRSSKSRVKLSFAREPLSFQRNPPDDFGLRGGERERLLFWGGEGGIFAMSGCGRRRREERLALGLGRELGKGRVVLRHATLCARETLMSIYITTSVILLYGFDLVFPIQFQHHNEKYIDCEAAFADHCAIQSVDSLSKQHVPSTSSSHPHWTGQDTDRSDSTMHPHCKGTHICNSTLEEPHRLRFYFLASSPDRIINHCCVSNPLALPGSYQSGYLFHHL
jgi:hypothetical protein